MVVVVAVREGAVLRSLGDAGCGVLVSQQRCACEKNSKVVMLGEEGPEEDTKDGGPDQPTPEEHNVLHYTSRTHSTAQWLRKVASSTVWLILVSRF